jgi:diaminohydroxyphosphoribosylaminopyrimidine deaminase/5-amino-6-(5-phosphoribosylamino)uracil reductase
MECTTDASGHIDPLAALRALGAAGLTRVFCEGGGTLAAALMAAGLVDRLVTFHAGHAFGAGGTPSFGPLPGADEVGAPGFRLDRVEQVGPDMLAEWSRA